MWPKVKYWAWEIVTKALLGMVYIAVISEGLRLLVPALGTRIWKAIPWLRFLRDYEDTYRLDLAPILAIFVLIAVWYLWDKILQVFLHTDEAVATEGFNPRPYRILVWTLGGIILCADAILFYTAMTHVSWRGTMFSFSALLATIAYLAVLVFISFVSLSLRNDLKKEKV